MKAITPCLWFSSEALDAAIYYTTTLPGSRITRIARYHEAGQEHHQKEPGSVMLVEFELLGRPFYALNGGPHYQLTPAMSLVLPCESAAELDAAWEALSSGGSLQQCGWLTDRFGLSWQVVPAFLGDIVAGPDQARAGRVMAALHEMVKLDFDALKAIAEAPSAD